MSSQAEDGADGPAHYQRLLEARERCEAAYAEARRQVFDEHTPGEIDVEALPTAQREVLARLEEAEQDVERLRLARHIHAPGE